MSIVSLKWISSRASAVGMGPEALIAEVVTTATGNVVTPLVLFDIYFAAGTLLPVHISDDLAG